LGSQLPPDRPGRYSGLRQPSSCCKAFSWQTVFIIFAVVILADPRRRCPSCGARSSRRHGKTLEPNEPMMHRPDPRTSSDPSYTLIFLGFFSCGYQLAFITAHFPAFVTELCSPIDRGRHPRRDLGITTTSALGAVSPSRSSGIVQHRRHGSDGRDTWASAFHRRNTCCSAIYVGRTLAAAAFILLPITPTSGPRSISAVMGSLWLATVPLTSGPGRTYSTASATWARFTAWCSCRHQIGGFLGVWLGGQDV
jgi:hypothetical protein